jgi:hypothetical protein
MAVRVLPQLRSVGIEVPSVGGEEFRRNRGAEVEVLGETDLTLRMKVEIEAVAYVGA